MSSTGNTHDQLKKVFNAFYEYPKTMKEVSTLRNANQISLVGYRKCRITGHNKVGTYTTNPQLFPKSNQLELFT
jgi:hypothetical protein